jgi:hypothetical protein
MSAALVFLAVGGVFFFGSNRHRPLGDGSGAAGAMAAMALESPDPLDDDANFGGFDGDEFGGACGSARLDVLQYAPHRVPH